MQDIYWNVGDVRINQRLDLNRYGSQHDLHQSSLPGLVGKVPANLSVNAGEFQELQLPLLTSAVSKSNKRIRAGIRTSTGRCFESKIDQTLEDWIRQAARETAP